MHDSDEIESIKNEFARLNRATAIRLQFSSKDDEALRIAIAALSDSDSTTRFAAANYFRTDFHEKALSALCERLDDPDTDVRRAARGALACNVVRWWMTPPGIEVQTRCIEQLKNGTPDQRWNAAEALRRFESPVAAKALLAAFDDPDDWVRQTAVWALGKFGQRRYVPQICKMLSDPVSGVRWAAARALNDIQAPEADEDLIRSLGDPDSEVAWEAAMALGQTRTPKAHAALLDLARNSTGDTRANAMSALSEFIGDFPLDIVDAALLEADPDVRRIATYRLDDIQPQEALPRIVNCLDDGERDVRSSALHRLSTLPQTMACPELLALLNDPKKFKLADILEAMQDCGCTIPKEFALSVLSHGSLTVRRLALWSLRKFKDDDAVAALRRALNDGEVMLAAIAELSLLAIGDSGMEMKIRDRCNQATADYLDEFAEELREALGSTNVELLTELYYGFDEERRAHFLWLATGYKNLQSLRDIVQSAANDSSAKVRMNAIDLCGELAGPGEIQLLERLSVDPDYWVRREAIHIWGTLGGPEFQQQMSVLLDDPDPSVRVLAALASAKKAMHQHTDKIQKLLSDVDGDVREAAEEALYTLRIDLAGRATATQ
jgi:HEAT repeat protein